jgi:DNA-binding XRE family transcriptional regulator
MSVAGEGRRRTDPTSWWGDSDLEVVSDLAFQCGLLPHICRAGRALLDISQAELAELTSLSRKTINKIEGGVGSPDVSTFTAIKAALSERGVAVEYRANRLYVSAGSDALKLDGSAQI